MKIQHGGFEFRYNKKDKPDMSTQDSHIRAVRNDESATPSKPSSDNSKFVEGATIIIKTYFMWKMADRVLEKVLR